MTHDPTQLPHGLPEPKDDGAAEHLTGRALPDLSLPSTSGRMVHLQALCGPRQLPREQEKSGGAVLFFYPRTGVPGEPAARGYNGEEWESVPGARGCTPQSCGFRDHAAEFAALGVHVYGVSTNTTAHQSEFAARQKLPYELLSDSGLELARAMNLPTFDWPVESGGPTTLLRRMAWYVTPDASGVARIRKVWYPVFPPDRNAENVLSWVRRRSAVMVREVLPNWSNDRAYLRSELARHWGGTDIWSKGRMYAACEMLPAFVAERREPDGGVKKIGHATYCVLPGSFQCEVVTLSGEGAGAVLLQAVADAARRSCCKRLFLTTSNDNLHALGFYQSQGWRLAALHKGTMDEARKRRANIPLRGHGGLRIRDEIELELWLE